MSFLNVLSDYQNFNFIEFLENVSKNDVYNTLNKCKANDLDFLRLISNEADDKAIIEEMAKKSSEITKRFFGKTISIFTPLYLSNICENGCLYCGFSRDNSIKRTKLSLEEIEKEAIAIRGLGIRHVIILTGDSKKSTPPEYIAQATKIIKKYIDSVSIEVYSLEPEDYEYLFKSGVDGFTMFQETYNKELYPILHPKGPKNDFNKRLNSPELACKASFHTVNIGALLGLDDWRIDSFFTYLHLNYLIDKYPATDFSVSLPRIRPTSTNDTYSPSSVVSDKNIVRLICAYRITLNRVGITVSSRETKEFRDNLIGIGVTRMSAGSITEVGGHSGDSKSDGQFEISDERSLLEMEKAIAKRGYQAVVKDWGTF